MTKAEIALAKYRKALEDLESRKSELLSVLREEYAEGLYQHGVGNRLKTLHDEFGITPSWASQVLSAFRDPKNPESILKLAVGMVSFKKSLKKF